MYTGNRFSFRLGINFAEKTGAYASHVIAEHNAESLPLRHGVYVHGSERKMFRRAELWALMSRGVKSASPDPHGKRRELKPYRTVQSILTTVYHGIV